MGTAMRRIIGTFLMLATITGGASAQTLSLQDLGVELTPLPSVTIYSAKQIVTLDPDKPTAQAVAVVGDRILAVGSLDELRLALRVCVDALDGPRAPRAPAPAPRCGENPGPRPGPLRRRDRRGAGADVRPRVLARRRGGDAGRGAPPAAPRRDLRTHRRAPARRGSCRSSGPCAGCGAPRRRG